MEAMAETQLIIQGTYHDSDQFSYKVQRRRRGFICTKNIKLQTFFLKTILSRSSHFTTILAYLSSIGTYNLVMKQYKANTFKVNHKSDCKRTSLSDPMIMVNRTNSESKFAKAEQRLIKILTPAQLIHSRQWFKYIFPVLTFNGQSKHLVFKIFFSQVHKSRVHKCVASVFSPGFGKLLLTGSSANFCLNSHLNQTQNHTGPLLKPHHGRPGHV